MGAQEAVTSEQILLSAWRRDFRLSLVLVGVGIVLLVTVSAFSVWANSAGHYTAPFWAGLTMGAATTAGAMLILLGGTVAYYHWSGLRQSRPNR